MGRKNDIKYRVTEEQIESLVELQHTILQNACRYVKAGGTLYIAPARSQRKKNTLQVERFLKEHPEYTLKNNDSSYKASMPVTDFIMRYCIS